jgi:hypothetical protein
LKQLEEGSDQSSDKAESSQSAPNHPQLITYRRERSRIENEERSFRLSNWNPEVTLMSTPIGYSPMQTSLIGELQLGQPSLPQPFTEPIVELDKVDFWVINQPIAGVIPIVSNSLDQSSKSSSGSSVFSKIFIYRVCGTNEIKSAAL